MLVQAANQRRASRTRRPRTSSPRAWTCSSWSPNNAKTAATIVESAHKAGVPVIAYDRLIRDSDVDLYVSFDAVRVGELQSRIRSCKHVPKGNYVLIGGAPTDNNALLVRDGQMKVAQAPHRQGRHQDRGRPVGQGLAARRGPEDHGERAHPQQQQGGRGGRVRTTARRAAPSRPWASRSSRARSWSRARTPTSPACQRILAGTQTMTVYKPQSTKLAPRRRRWPILLARKQPLADQTSADEQRQEGRARASSSTPIAVDKDNIVADRGRGRLPQARGRSTGTCPKEQCPKP